VEVEQTYGSLREAKKAHYPPTSYSIEGEELHEENKEDREVRMRRYYSLRDWESTHHGSMGHP